MSEKPANHGQPVREIIVEDAERQRKIERNKNRNLHSVKFSDDLEEDYQAWKTWYDLSSDNAALRRLVSTHPELKTKPQNHDN